MDLRSLARALGGEVVGGQVLAPGPGGHSRKDRSLSVRLSPTAPDGFLAFSHAGDDWRACRDHVKARLGLSRGNAPRRPLRSPERALARARRIDTRERRSPMRSPMAAGVDPRERSSSYLNSRALDSARTSPEPVLRWHPGVGAMLALFRDIRTDAPQAV